MNRIARRVSAVCFCLTFVWQAASHGQATPAVSFSGGGVDADADTNGWRFQALQNIDVTSLGSWDEGGDGLPSGVDVGIWTDAGALLGSLTLASGTSATLQDGFRYADLAAPVSLTTGQFYRVASSANLGTIQFRFSGAFSVTSLVQAAAIDHDAGYYADSTNTLTFPNLPSLIRPSREFFGANFQYVPKPSRTAYALNSNGQTLIQFDLATPGSFTTVGPITGAATTLAGLDFRPADGKLYGYDPFGSPDQLVVIDPATAVTTFVSTPSTGSSNFTLGLDFNPAADRLRLVNTDDQNLRINVDTGATTVDGALAYAAGDANAGAAVNVAEAAYTNNDNDAGTGTTLYYIDHVLDVLVTTAAPNAGTLNTVGGLGVNTDSFDGFDIYTDAAGVNSSYALLTVGGTPGLYGIDLATGAATPLGALAGDAPLSSAYGLAIVPIPEPASLALLGLAGLALLTSRASVRGRRRAVGATALAAVALLATAEPARADIDWRVSFASESGIVTTSGDPAAFVPADYDILAVLFQTSDGQTIDTSVTAPSFITWDGSSVTGINGDPDFAYFIADAPPSSFTRGMDIRADGKTSEYFFAVVGGGISEGPTTWAPQIVPEPASLALLGLAGLVLLTSRASVRSRRRS